MRNENLNKPQDPQCVQTSVSKSVLKSTDLIVGKHYETPSSAVFVFIKLDDDGDMVMKSVRNFMKIQSGITTFFWWYAEDLKLVETVC